MVADRLVMAIMALDTGTPTPSTPRVGSGAPPAAGQMTRAHGFASNVASRCCPNHALANNAAIRNSQGPSSVTNVGKRLDER